MSFVTLELIGARLRVARSRPGAVVVALATATVVPILISVSAAVTADNALARGLAGLAPGDRSAIVSDAGFLDAAQEASADALVRRDLPALVEGPIRRQLEFRALADSGGQPFVLAATDGLSSAVRITAGRAPRSCTPTRCEVVVISAPGGRDPIVRSGYGLVIVGRAVRTDPFLLTGTFDPGPQLPILLSDGVAATARNRPLALIQRSYGWVAPLDRQVIIAQGVDAWARTATNVANRLWLAQARMALVTPDQTVRDQADRARVSARRFGLLAGGCAVLLLGSALIGGAALRPDEARFVAALRRRGLSPNRIRAVVAAEAAAIAGVAVLLGLLGGVALSGVLAARSDLPVTSTAMKALGTGLPAVLALGVAAFLLLTLTLWPQAGHPEEVDEQPAWQAVTWAGIGGLLALLLVISRGRASSGPDGSEDPLLIALPGLVLLTLGLGTARAWPLVVRVVYRLLPRSAVGSRLGVAGIAGRPLLAASTAALLAAAVGATGFAASYRSTLERGAADQAVFQVPMTATIGPGSGLRPVLAVASVARYRQLAPGAQVVPVLRQAGSIRSGSQTANVIQSIGLAPEALRELHRWPTVVAGPSPQKVARAIAAPAAAPGLRLPPGRTLRIRLAGGAPAVELTAWLRAADGREQSVPLVAGPAGGAGPAGSAGSAGSAGGAGGAGSAGPSSGGGTGSALTGPLPADVSAGWSLIALSLSQSTDDATRRQHGLGEGSTSRAVPAGVIGLRDLQVDGVPLPRPWSGWNGAGLTVSTDGAAAVLNYRLIASTLVINARPPGPGTPSGPALPVAADPRTAASGPLITLTVNGAPVKARVVAVLPRFPTVTGRFVIADREALSAVLDQTSPGQGQAGEIWLDLPGSTNQGQVRARLAAGPFVGVGVSWSSDLERGLRTDPVARGATQLLILAAGLTLLVALVALVLLVIAERTEDADEIYTWEANGVRPNVLRRALWIRAVLVAGLAVPVGVIGGLALTSLTARLVNLTAGGGLPQPPLVAVTGLTTALSAVLIGLAVALSVSGLVALTSFREPLPRLGPHSAGDAA